MRSHKCYIVNMSLIESVIPWADRAYQVKFTNIRGEALISRSKYHLFNSCISI
ncbi:LytTR family DNA-binding domain-containing protein [Dehalococcoides sp. HCBD]|uniref:LytTR family DNA-binding domain-containing protein n=1 Tax=Dehalococcoides sp. HCBD TaxID=3440628 RepID=UPI003F5CAD18